MCPVASDGISGQWNLLYDDSTSSTGKQWAKLWCSVRDISEVTSDSGLADVVKGTAIGICPKETNNLGFTPYRLVYKKLRASKTKICVHGDLNTKDNLSVDASSGLVLREKCKNAILNELFYFNPSTNTVDLNFKSNNRVQDILSWYTATGEQPNYGKLVRPIALETANIIGEIQLSSDKSMEDIYVDYTIYDNDTVKYFEVELEIPKIVRDVIDTTVKKLREVNSELNATKTELNILRDRCNMLGSNNLLKNGDFSIWQRGESFNLSATTKDHSVVRYTADRWKFANFVFNKADNDFIITRTKDGLNVKSANGAKYGFFAFSQPIESNEYLKGKTVTLSFEIETKYDLPKTHVYIDSADTPFSCSYGTYKAGKTIMTRTFKMPASSSGSVDIQLIRCDYLTGPIDFTIKWAKLEIGDVATPFIPKAYVDELSECMYYYQRVFPTEVAATRITPTNIIAYTSLPVPMRTIPTVQGDFAVIDIRDNNGEPTTSIVTHGAIQQIAVEAKGSFDINKPFGIMQTNVSADAEIYF